MGPERFGRTLGIGVRVASNILRDRAGRVAQGNVQPAAGRPASSSPSPLSAANPKNTFPTRNLRQEAAKATVTTRKATAGIGRGTKNFTQAFWAPFRHASGVLWLEISGVFFALFALFFAQNVYRTHAAWRQGAEHLHFLLYVAFTALFGWFSMSSFLQARRKSRKARQN